MIIIGQFLVGLCTFIFALLFVCIFYGVGEWVFEDGFKQGLLRLAGTGLGLFILWSIGALISGI
jgi:hypothetical protein